MSIKDNQKEYEQALEQAHREFPLMEYKTKPEQCIPHNYDFVVFCDGGDWDIVRCTRCGSEKIKRCTFDDDNY